MKHKLLLYCSVLLMIMLLLCGLCGCKQTPKELAPPQNVCVDKRVVTWDKDAHASGYAVRIKQKEYEITDCSFSIHSMTTEGGRYTIDVLALGDGKQYEDSAWTRITVELEPAVAEGYDEAQFRYVLLEDGSGYEVSRGYADLEGVITIPAFFGDYPVKRIAEKAFFYDVFGANCFTEEYCNIATTGVVLPDTLESIGANAFACMVRLKEITIPDSVVSIEGGAFAGCTHMTHVTLPRGLEEIPNRCFEDTALAEIVFPNSLKKIGESAFLCRYYDMSAYDAPDVIGHIYSDLTSISLPDSLEYIGRVAFSGRESLAEIHCSDNFDVEFFDSGVFKETKWLDEQPVGLIVLGVVLYSHKGTIPSLMIEVPSTVKTIAGGAFAYQKAVEAIVLPEGVKLAGPSIFDHCESLSTIKLPEGNTIIYHNMLAYTYALKEVIIPSTVTLIEPHAFYKSGIEQLTVPSSVKEIDKNAFSGCEGLIEVYLSDGLEVLFENAFSNCYNLVKIRLPNTLKELKSYTFGRCNAQEIVIPRSFKTIQYYAFSEAPLSRVYFEGTLEELNEIVNAQKSNPFSDAILYCYSEQAPTEEGNFWHYVDGIPTVW